MNPQINPCADDRGPNRVDHGAMTITDYLINAVFVLVVLRQARERRLDTRSFVVPMIVVLWAATHYIHSLPVAGNDLVLVALLGGVGLTLGLASGLATQVRLDGTRQAVVRVGWLAGSLLLAGICSRMVFAFAVSNGAGPAVRSFSITHHIGAAAWPVALVAMALLEVGTRLVLVQLRGHRLTAGTAAATSIGSLGSAA